MTIFKSLRFGLGLGVLLILLSSVGLAQKPVANGVYQIVHDKSGHCIDIQDGTSDNYGGVIVNNCNSNAEHRQFWIHSDMNTGNGWEYTIQAVHSGSCVDVEAYSTETNGNIHQWECHLDDNQRWIFEPIGTSFRIKSVHSNMCMEVDRNSTMWGTNVLQHDCDGDDHELFDLKAVYSGDYEFGRTNGVYLADITLTQDLTTVTDADGHTFDAFRIQFNNTPPSPNEHAWRYNPNDKVINFYSDAGEHSTDFLSVDVSAQRWEGAFLLVPEWNVTHYIDKK